MKLIFIHGPAAAGKLTIGRALQELTGFRLFHNHLVVDTLLSVFQFGTAPFVRLREQMWLSVFREAARESESLIFTFNPEATVDPGFIERALAAVGEAGGVIQFVELVCPVEELERRMDDPSRAQFHKLRSVETFRKIRQTNADRYPRLPAGLRIDSSANSPLESARAICEHFNLPIAPESNRIEHYPPIP